MKENQAIVKISVRNLVEFLLRSGDLTSGGSGVRNPEAMLEGSRIHRKIQKSMGIGYEAEVPLLTTRTFRSEVTGEDFTLQVEGRADGILRSPEENEPSSSRKKKEKAPSVLVDEIKGVYRNLKEISAPDPVHLAQAKCYAYMILTAEKLDEIAVQVTYCNIDSPDSPEGIKRFQENYSAEDILRWFDDLMEKYRPWAVYEYDWRLRRDDSIGKLIFPFPFREGQDDLTAFTYQSLDRGGRLFIEAPTGVGKTISTVFPAVKIMGEGKSDRIFYLTAKTITRTVAEDCFSLLTKNGLIFKSITLTAKEKLCILDKPDCDKTRCERADGHFDRVNEALYEMLTVEDRISRQIILTYAEKYRVCPFELSLDAALFADAVIGDYNYVFDPNVYLRRFFSTQKKGNMILLIDEAHNLVERGREMYSARLIKEDFLRIARIAKKMMKTEHRPDAVYSLRQLIHSVEAVNRSLLAYKRECDRFLEIPDLPNLGFQLLRVVANYEVMAAENPVLPERELFVEFYFSVRNFLNIWESYDDHYRIYANYDEEGQFCLTLQCMDPSRRLREVCDRTKAGVFFSATLLPIRYYKEQLGGDADDPAVYAKSSFGEEQRQILIAEDVTSLYRSRGPVMYGRIASYIEKMVTSQTGNYLIFFPSYQFMEEVTDRLTLPDDRKILIQDRRMSESGREEFLAAFEDENIIGMCVMGGIFAEGIDLTGDRLIGAAIVGTGLPMVCDERELFKRYFDREKGNGFDYAYLYPGLGKVFQAGGRVIRTASDRGVILLLDDRFLRQEYKREFPREWNSFQTVSVDTVSDALKDFWGQKNSCIDEKL